MYNATLKILYPNNSQLDTAMNNLKMRENFSYDLIKYHNLKDEDIEKANIILVLHSDGYEARKIKKFMNPNAILIYILEHSILTDKDALFNLVDDIWFSPLSEIEILFRIEK